MATYKIAKLKLRAGDKWDWVEDNTGVDNTLYYLRVVMKLKDGEPVIIKSSAYSNGFRFVHAGTDLPNGDYNLILQKISIADKSAVTIFSMIKHVYPDLTKAGVDSRSYLQKVLENLRDAYEKLTKEIASEVVLMDGRKVTLKDSEKLYMEIRRLEMRLKVEHKKGSTRENYYVRFVKS